MYSVFCKWSFFFWFWASYVSRSLDICAVRSRKGCLEISWYKPSWKQELWSDCMGLVWFWVVPKAGWPFCPTLSNIGVFPWETVFFRFLLFISLIGACAFCLAFYICAAFKESFPLLYALQLHTWKTSFLSSLGNKTLPPDPLKITNIHLAQHILDVRLWVCAMHRALAGFCFPVLSLLCIHSSSSEDWMRRLPSLSLLQYLCEFDGFDLGWLPARYSPTCSVTSLSPQDGGESKMGKLWWDKVEYCH